MTLLLRKAKLIKVYMNVNVVTKIILVIVSVVTWKILKSLSAR